MVRDPRSAGNSYQVLRAKLWWRHISRHKFPSSIQMQTKHASFARTTRYKRTQYIQRVSGRGYQVSQFHVMHEACFERDCVVSDVEDPADPTTWRFQLMATWPPGPPSSQVTLQTLDSEVTLAELKERTSDLCEPFRSANQWLPDDTKVSMNRISYWIPSPWSARFGSRVQLAGDAAHAMSFQRGQGVNHGIADASLLMDAVRKVHGKTSSMSDAMTDYEQEVVTRAGEEVRVSVSLGSSLNPGSTLILVMRQAHNTEMLHDWNMLMDSPVMKRSAAASLTNKQAHSGYRM